MKTALMMAVAGLALAAHGRAAEPAGQPARTAGWIGTNYTPACAANQIQMWHEFKPEVIDRELAAAVRCFGINTLRVYLHNIVGDLQRAEHGGRVHRQAPRGGIRLGQGGEAGAAGHCLLGRPSVGVQAWADDLVVLPAEP